MRETGIFLDMEKGSFTCRAAALIIKDGKLLAAKNMYPAYYTVGGAVEIGETSEEAVVREVFEETGYRLEIDKLAFIQERFYHFSGRQNHEVVFFYLMKERAGLDIPDGSYTDQAPMETLHWLPIDRLGEINIIPAFLKTQSYDDILGIRHIITKEQSSP